MKIELKGIKKTYVSAGAENLSVDVLKGFDVVIGQGEYVSFIGKSGCGKTTLLKIMGLLMSPTEGELFIDGRKISGLWTDELADIRRRRMGFVFQEYNLLDTLTLEENIMLVMTLHRRKKREIQSQCQKLMSLLGIEEVKGKYPYQVSGGQKQRCACARALANHPTLLLADEPTGALDSQAAQTLLETFVDMNKKMGATIFMVTHDAFSASYCSRILFLKDGKIFHELVRGDKKRREFLNEILDILSLTGGESFHDA